MTLPGQAMVLAGQAMLVLAAGLLLVGAGIAVPRAFRVRRRARLLSRSLAAGRAEVLALLEERTRLQEETARLSAPGRRTLRWVRHPLVGALWKSYRIRRRRRAG